MHGWHSSPTRSLRHPALLAALRDDTSVVLHLHLGSIVTHEPLAAIAALCAVDELAVVFLPARDQTVSLRLSLSAFAAVRRWSAHARCELLLVTGERDAGRWLLTASARSDHSAFVVMDKGFPPRAVHVSNNCMASP